MNWIRTRTNHREQHAPCTIQIGMGEDAIQKQNSTAPMCTRTTTPYRAEPRCHEHPPRTPEEGSGPPTAWPLLISRDHGHAAARSLTRRRRLPHLGATGTQPPTPGTTPQPHPWEPTHKHKHAATPPHPATNIPHRTIIAPGRASPDAGGRTPGPACCLSQALGWAGRRHACAEAKYNPPRDQSLVSIFFSLRLRWRHMPCGCIWQERPGGVHHRKRREHVSLSTYGCVCVCVCVEYQVGIGCMRAWGISLAKRKIIGHNNR